MAHQQKGRSFFPEASGTLSRFKAFVKTANGWFTLFTLKALKRITAQNNSTVIKRIFSRHYFPHYLSLV